MPNEYYLFSIAKFENGFAIWDSTVSVVNGKNVLEPSPQTITDVSNLALNGQP
jgi:hypothetical protein